MNPDPRSWGRIAQAALVVLVVARLPGALATPDPVVAAGSVTGVVLGAFVLVAVLRWVAKITPGTGVGGEPRRQS